MTDGEHIPSINQLINQSITLLSLRNYHYQSLTLVVFVPMITFERSDV